LEAKLALLACCDELLLLLLLVFLEEGTAGCLNFSEAVCAPEVEIVDVFCEDLMGLT